MIKFLVGYVRSGAKEWTGENKTKSAELCSFVFFFIFVRVFMKHKQTVSEPEKGSTKPRYRDATCHFYFLRCEFMNTLCCEYTYALGVVCETLRNFNPEIFCGIYAKRA